MGAYYLHPPDARAIFLHSDLLCNETCFVTGGSIKYWGRRGAQTEKIPDTLGKIFANQSHFSPWFHPSQGHSRIVDKSVDDSIVLGLNQLFQFGHTLFRTDV